MFAPHDRRPSLRLHFEKSNTVSFFGQRFPKEYKSASSLFPSSSEFSRRILPADKRAIPPSSDLSWLPTISTLLIGEISSGETRPDPPEIAAGEARVSTPATASPNKPAYRPVHRYTNEPRRDTRQHPANPGIYFYGPVHRFSLSPQLFFSSSRSP